jgi:hypothetical protein
MNIFVNGLDGRGLKVVGGCARRRVGRKARIDVFIIVTVSTRHGLLRNWRCVSARKLSR